MHFVCVILTFQNLDLQKVGQGHGVQLPQIHHSMSNVKIYKCLPHIFVLALTLSDIYKFQICYHQKVGQWHGVQFRTTSMANIEVNKSLFYILYFLYDPTCGNEINRHTHTQKRRGHCYRRNRRFALIFLDSPYVLEHLNCR